MAATNAGGAFGGMPLMNNGTHGTTPRAGSDQEDNDFEARLNTYIYDFFLKSENYQCARTMLTSGVPMEPPVRRRDEMNGADDNMHTDAKDDMDSKRPEDLPPVLGWSENSFLLDWFSCFWDFFFARKSDNNNKASANAMVYLQHTQVRGHSPVVRGDADRCQCSSNLESIESSSNKCSAPRLA